MTAADELRAERDRWRARCEAAERQAEELATELGQARAELARRRAATPAGTSRPVAAADDDAPLGLLSDDAAGRSRLDSDGRDPAVLPMALAGTAVVAAMVAVLAAVNGTLLTPFGIAVVLLAAALGVTAWRARLVRTEVQVDRGILTARRGGTTYRFDLRSEATHVEMDGRPGDAAWQVRFLRRSLDPRVLDRRAVDPHAFTEQLREWRPDL